jgi:hypothetical protein
MLGAGIALSGACSVVAQGVVDYPPATGHMVFIPPSTPAPGGVGSQYVETFPQGAVGYYEPGAVIQGGPYTYQSNPAPVVRTRGRFFRGARGARVYSRGYNQAPAPYATALPQGQLYWPGSYLAPAYTPFSRFQTYGSGYTQSPYGSNFYGGYYKGYSMGY